MAGIQVTGPASPSAVTVSSKSTATISSAIMTVTPGDETAVVIPIGTKAFAIRAKSSGGVATKLTIATTSGDTSSDDSFDIMPGNTWREESLVGAAALTFYMASTKASTIVQIITWS